MRIFIHNSNISFQLEFLDLSPSRCGQPVNVDDVVLRGREDTCRAPFSFELIPDGMIASMDIRCHLALELVKRFVGYHLAVPWTKAPAELHSEVDQIAAVCLPFFGNSPVQHTGIQKPCRASRFDLLDLGVQRSASLLDG